MPPSAPASPRAVILRQAASISAAVGPFGVAFGVACSEAGLSWGHAVGFSTLVFTGSAQFAAVSVLADGGAVAAAVVAGVLLNIRSLAFGLAMAPALGGPWWKRAAMSQLMIDESMAVGAAQTELAWRRYGYLAAGLGVFVVWNLTTLIGAVLLSDAGSIVTDFGIDATIPAVFLALLWPRLGDDVERTIALAGAAIALVLAPVAPAGLPIIAAAGAALIAARPSGDVAKEAP